MAWVEKIADHLVTQSIGTKGTDLFEGRMPDTPDAVVVLNESPGSSPEYAHERAAPVIEHARFQVRTRATTRAAAQTKADDVLTALQSLVASTALGGVTFYQVTPVQSRPIELEVDGQNRSVFSQTFDVRKRG